MRISLRKLSLSVQGTDMREDTLSNFPEETTERARAGQHLTFAHRCGANFVKKIRHLRPIAAGGYTLLTLSFLLSAIRKNNRQETGT